MKGSVLQVTLEKLGITPSHSRPRVSNDNAYSEALFRTCKYRPGYPTEGFARVDDARLWVHNFVAWYNHEHRHSAIRFLAPAERHARQDAVILEKRRQVYQLARQHHPARWSGRLRNWDPIGSVWLNPSSDGQITHVSSDRMDALHSNREGGSYLVRRPDIAAIAFTGSYRGRVALLRAANGRPRPVPFVGELGSINPLVVTPQVLSNGVHKPTKFLASSIAVGYWQYCTSPRLILVNADSSGTLFNTALADAFQGYAPPGILTPSIRAGFDQGVARLAVHPQVTIIHSSDIENRAAQSWLEMAGTNPRQRRLRDQAR